MSQKEINAVKSRIGDIRRKLREAERELSLAKLRHAGLDIGDRIEVLRDGEPVSAFVTGWVDAFEKPAAVLAKKDGAPGAREIFIGADKWRKVEAGE